MGIAALGHVKQLELALNGHFLPHIPAPSLYHEQEVEGLPPLGLVLLEEPLRLGHKSLYLAGQQ